MNEAPKRPSRARSLAPALALVVCAAPALAKESAMHAGELAHELDRVANTGRVLYVAAHPDDENTRLLAHLANSRHVLAGYLSMTRGGGGQNLIGTEQGELLDVIRTEELLAARALDGAVQRFTRMRDFGYSKTAKETFENWDHDEALADVVWVLRTFQPDVVITRFDENPPNHGHHTASAILAREAFEAAADPKRFPEQLADGVQPWKATRLLHNFPTWRDVPPPKDALELDVGAYDPRLGLGYGELAALSRSQHRSQGFGVAGERGRLVERFVFVAGRRPEADLLEGVETGWARFGAPAAPLAKALDEAGAQLGRDHPERALPPLLSAHRALDALPDGPRVRDARRRLERVVAGAAGLFVRASAPQPFAVPGAAVNVGVEVVMGRPAALTLTRVTFPGVAAVEVNARLGQHEKQVVSREVPIPADAPVSAPYWLAEPSLPGRQTVSDRRLVGEPKGPPALAAVVELAAGDRVLRLDVPVVHAWTDPVYGERVRPFLVVPPATVTPTRQAVMFPNGRSAPVAIRIRAGRDALRGEVTPGLPAGWVVKPATHAVDLARAGDETTVVFDVTPPPNAKSIGSSPAISVDGKAWSWREARIDYPHLPLQVVLQPAALRLVPLALNLPKGRVGYVMGSGDTVADDLAHVGLQVEVLDEATIRSGDLGRYAAIVVGIRAYNTRPILRAAHARLMEFVARGGTVVVQYNTHSRLAPLEVPIGPYPLEIGRDRITDERAQMTPVNPKHPLLRAPNVLEPADFDGWVQERGIYFASKWDGRYEPIYAAADPGEQPLLGGTLVARHGRGRYVYTGLVFFRQLPAGVPGAYRLFMNLLGGK